MNCDRIAAVYVIGERLCFGRALERCRTAHLSRLRRHEAALVCGDGDGRFLRALVESQVARRVDYVDVSPRMTALARVRVGAAVACSRSDVTLRCADIRVLDPPRTYDLIATHFFLDCFSDEEILAVVARIASLASGNATWLISEFQIPRRGVARYLGSIAVGALYWTFGILTGLAVRRLPDYRAALSSCGFRCVDERPAYGGLLTAQVWQRGRSDAGRAGIQNSECGIQNS